jgi:hypothetical protein
MLVRFAAFCLVVLAGAAALVAPSQPEAPVPEPAPPVESAIALLGETWTLAAPEPVVIAPVSSAVTAGAAAHALRPEPRQDDLASDPVASRTADLRTPQRRPAGLSAGTTPLPSAQVARTAPQASASAGTAAPRWIVRDQGTGAVLAELPLTEALALMQARSLRP